MPIQTMVAVLLRDADGTVDMRGTAFLLAPNQVILHRPVSDRFAENTPDPADLSVVVASWAGIAPTAEQIGVSRIAVAPQPFEGPAGQSFTIVGMVLESDSTAPPLAIDHTPEAIAAYLADPFDGRAVQFTHRKGPHDPNILCRMCGICC